MSTTVTYKGQTLTTVENQTKTLNTAGTWVEGDFTLTDVSEAGADWSAVAMGELPSGAITLNLTSAIPDGKFRGCKNLTSVTLASVPSNMTIGDATFRECTNLESVDLGNTYELKNVVFNRCTKLKTIRMNANPSRLSGSYIFENSGVEEAYFPYMVYELGRCFQGASNIRVVDFGNIDGVRGNTFADCHALRTIILRRTTRAFLDGWNATVQGMYENPTESTVYVPQALISDYQTATNWATGYAAGLTFLPIEGSEYEL